MNDKKMIFPEKIFCRFKVHPGDLLRNNDIFQLPNPNDNLEDFLIWFMNNYQSDDRLAYLDDLYKLFDDDFSDEETKARFIDQVGNMTVGEIKEAIEFEENELKVEAYTNFYHLVLSDKIEIVRPNEK